jgi:hypothetical protein
METRYRNLALAVILSFVPSLLFAQGPNLQVPYKVAFCWDQKESDGITPATGPFQVLITIDTTAQPFVPLPAPVGVAGTGGCTAGSFPYVLSGYSSTKGPHTVKGSIVSPDGTGTASAPFAFVVVGRPPSTVTGLQAIQ